MLSNIILFSARFFFKNKKNGHSEERREEKDNDWCFIRFRICFGKAYIGLYTVHTVYNELFILFRFILQIFKVPH